MIQKSQKERKWWAQFDALEMGTGWDDVDITKPQIMIESVYGDSHPGSYHLNQMVEQAVYGVYEMGGKPAKYYATDICDGCTQGHDGMNFVLASREAITNMVEVHGCAVPWDGMILSSSCDKSIPAHLKAIARLNIPSIFMPGGSMRPGPNMTTSTVAGDISLREKRGDVPAQELRDYKLTGCPSVGACTFLGTASTMQCLAEALGMTLPGAALVPATMRDLLQYSRYAGRKIMELAEKGITPVAALSGNNTTDGATKAMEDLLNAYPDQINLVFCHNDDTAIGALNACQAAGVEGITIIGFDGNASAIELIASGDLAGTIAQQPKLMGYQSVYAAYAAATGETIDAVQPVDVAIIDAANVADYQ